ncbi:MAG: hypothetical protein R2793_02335 [Flavobacteriaceae bacterium]
MVRFEDARPFQHLRWACAAHLLPEMDDCRYPSQQRHFIALARSVAVSSAICYVKGTRDSEINRVLMEFSFFGNRTLTEELTLEIKRHETLQNIPNL